MGDAIPQFRLGTMYQEGRGVAQDLGQARRWYEESAFKGQRIRSRGPCENVRFLETVAIRLPCLGGPAGRFPLAVSHIPAYIYRSLVRACSPPPRECA